MQRNMLLTAVASRLPRTLSGSAAAILLAACLMLVPSSVLPGKSVVEASLLPAWMISKAERDASIHLYKDIFALLRQGDWPGADTLIAKITNPVLLGHVRAERYLDTRYKANYGELASWLSQHGDLPQARSIHRIARQKQSNGGTLAASIPSIRIPSLRAGDLRVSVLRGAKTGAWQHALNTYRKGDFEAAGLRFAGLLEDDLPPADRSAAAFWAWRTYQASGREEEAVRYLAMAAAVPHSFYGILARQALKRDIGPSTGDVVLDSAIRDNLLAAVPALRRAEALVAIGETALAEKELMIAFAQTRDSDILKLAGEWNMASLQMRLAGMLQEDDPARDLALYPMPGWQPEEGYAVDPALLYAIARQESGFNLRAQSPAGALGLMQLMPQTANYVARRTRPALSTAELRHQLYEPKTNITLGQDYIRYLMKQSEVGHNLIFLLASYNAGPGKLQEWKNSLDYKRDPLLFIEMIPYKETRNYVQNVLANYWIYSSLLGGRPASVQSLLQKNWPRYQADNLKLAARIS